MPEWLAGIETWMAEGRGWGLLQAAIIVTVGLLVGRVLSAAAARTFAGRLDAHRMMIVRRVIFYLVLALALATALNELGFKLSVLLGAAGVLSVAIGFASQTSASNLISGLFLVGERPFGIGDAIRVGATEGEVLSIDLLSVKLRTSDNLFVRIPNETLIKTEVVNFSRFPIRRVDFKLGVAYKEDIGRVRGVLLQIAEDNALCLEDPRPIFAVVGFGASSIDLQISLWTRRDNVLELKNSIYSQIKNAFDAGGIEIPYPHINLDTGGGPIPIRLVNDDGRADSRSI